MTEYRYLLANKHIFYSVSWRFGIKPFHTSPSLCARYEITGIKEENLQDAMPLEEAWEKIQQILHNGGSIITVRLDGGKAKVLVGDYFEKHLDFLEMNYHDHLLW